jgi:hypothetical protein
MKNDINPTAAAVNFKIQATNKTQAVSKSFSVTASEELSANSIVWDTALMVVSKIELEAEKHEGSLHRSGSGNHNSGSGNDNSGSDDNGNDGNSGSGNSGSDHLLGDNGHDDNSSNDSSRVSFEWRGPKTIDLFNLNSVTGGIILDPGSFNNLTIKIEAFKSDAVSTPLFYLAGDFTNTSASTKRINIVINEDFELKIRNLDTLDLGQNFTSVIKVNLVQLMSTVTMAELENADLTNGVLVISSATNVALYNKVKKNFHESEHSEFERD